MEDSQTQINHLQTQMNHLQTPFQIFSQEYIEKNEEILKHLSLREKAFKVADAWEHLPPGEKHEYYDAIGRTYQINSKGQSKLLLLSQESESDSYNSIPISKRMFVSTRKANTTIEKQEKIIPESKSEEVICSKRRRSGRKKNTQ